MMQSFHLCVVAGKQTAFGVRININININIHIHIKINNKENR